MSYPRVSIILLNWNGLEDTIECVESLRKISYPNFDVIVFDNGSTNPYEKNIIHERFGDFVCVIGSVKNLGFAGGFNLAVKYAIGKYNPDYLLRLDNDTLVDKFCLSHLINAIKDDSMVCAAVSTVYDRVHPECLQQRPNIKFNFWIGDIAERQGLLKFVGEGMHRFLRIKPRVYDDGENITEQVGCCTLFKRNCIDNVGLMDKSYFFTWEAVDYSERIRAAGYKMVFVPQAKIWHKWRTANEIDGRTEYYNPKNRFKFMKKYASLPQKVSFVTYFFAIHFWLAMAYYLLWCRRFDAAKSFCCGVRDGIFKK